MNKLRDIAIKCLQDEAQILLDQIPSVDDQFLKAVDLLYKCNGKVVVTGVGKSGHIGAKIAATFSSTGTPSFYVNPLDLYHGDLGVITADDIVIAISNSGQTDELLRIIPNMLERDIPIIGISGNAQSLLAKYCNAHILLRVRREATPAGTYDLTHGLDGCAPHDRFCTFPSRRLIGQTVAHKSIRRDV